MSKNSIETIDYLSLCIITDVSEYVNCLRIILTNSSPSTLNIDFLEKVYDFAKALNEKGFKGTLDIRCDAYDVFNFSREKQMPTNVIINGMYKDVFGFADLARTMWKDPLKGCPSKSDGILYLATAAVRTFDNSDGKRYVIYPSDNGSVSFENISFVVGCATSVNCPNFVLDLLRFSGHLAIRPPREEKKIQVYDSTKNEFAGLTIPKDRSESVSIYRGSNPLGLCVDANISRNARFLQAFLNRASADELSAILISQDLSAILGKIEGDRSSFGSNNSGVSYTLLLDDIVSRLMGSYSCLLEVIKMLPSDVLVYFTDLERESLGLPLALKYNDALNADEKMGILMQYINHLCKRLCEARDYGMVIKQGVLSLK